MLNTFVLWSDDPGAFARVSRLDEFSMFEVKAHHGDTLVRGIVTKNDAGFRGRQWEDDITGQQHRTLREASRAIMTEAKMREQFRVWLKVNGKVED